MAIKKVRMYECDSKDCESVVFDAFDRMPKGWGWRHVTFRDGKKVKLLESHSYDMYLFCPVCIEKEDINVAGFC